MRAWAKPPNPLVVAGDLEAFVKHAIAAVAPKPLVEHAHGWLPGRVAGPFDHPGEIGKPSATRREME